MGFLPEHIESRLRQEIDGRGLVLLDLKQRGERGSTVYEIVVDSETSEVKLDDLAELNRWAGALFDEVEDKLPSRYRLEVSTAGLGRPLEHLWQYRKNVGRLLKISYRDDGGTIRNDLFRLKAIEGEELMVVPKGAKKQKADAVELRIPADRVIKAAVEPEF